MGFLSRLIAPVKWATQTAAVPRTTEFTLSPGAITAAAGFTRDRREITGAGAVYHCYAVTVDLRNASTRVTFDRGSFSQPVHNGAADRLQPGGIIEAYSLTPAADTADGDVRVIEHVVHHEDVELLLGAGSRRF